MGKMRLLFIDSYLSYRDDALKDRFEKMLFWGIFLYFYCEKPSLPLFPPSSSSSNDKISDKTKHIMKISHINVNSYDKTVTSQQK
jgi:hypothetical protein